MIDIYLTHYATRSLPGYNDIAIDCVHDILEATKDDGIEYQLIVICWTDSQTLMKDLRDRMPREVSLEPQLWGNQCFLMNQATKIARARGAEMFLCLHNDIRCSRGWLRNIVSDVRAAEAVHGRGNVIASPRYLPYHWIDPHTDAYKHRAFWDRFRPEVEAKVLSIDAMAEFCKRHGFEFDGERVVSPATSYTTDDGHMLMMYCAAPEFFDEIGGVDESFVGKNYGDCDWGIRALMAGKKNLQSQGCLLGHIAGLTFFNPAFDCVGNNDGRFIAKWGPAVFAELQNGSLWPRLHREQLAP